MKCKTAQRKLIQGENKNTHSAEKYVSIIVIVIAIKNIPPMDG
jgi:hypothetical protein